MAVWKSCSRPIGHSKWRRCWPARRRTRRKPTRLLAALDLAVADDEGILLRACRLAVKLDHHLFDTLYHAVALERSAVLITADEHYLRKAERMGHIHALADWAGA